MLDVGSSPGNRRDERWTDGGGTGFSQVTQDERDLAALRAGDEDVFARLVDEYGPGLLRLAMSYVGDRATAEDVVQETWIGLLGSLDRFEGRASLKTWTFRILVNVARKRRDRDHRSVPVADLGGGEPALGPQRFHGSNARSPGHWIEFPNPWDLSPEDRVVSGELMTRVQSAIAKLPPSQRAVITLRDIEGWDAEEVCNALGLSGTNQRVLLHRARSKVRAALERYLDQQAVIA